MKYVRIYAVYLTPYIFLFVLEQYIIVHLKIRIVYTDHLYVRTF